MRVSSFVCVISLVLSLICSSVRAACGVGLGAGALVNGQPLQSVNAGDVVTLGLGFSTFVDPLWPCDNPAIASALFAPNDGSVPAVLEVAGVYVPDVRHDFQTTYIVQASDISDGLAVVGKMVFVGAPSGVGQAERVITLTHVSESSMQNLMAVLHHWGASGTPGQVGGDINFDGAANIDDLVKILTSWH